MEVRSDVRVRIDVDFKNAHLHARNVNNIYAGTPGLHT